MSVALPAVVRAADVTQRLIDFGATLTPTLGGPSQRIARLGARYALDVRMPPLDDASARAMLGALLKAQTEAATLTLSWPQPAAAALGSVLVNGAGQAGSSLILDHFTAGVSIPALTFFSFIMGGRYYLHCITAATAANGSGQATVAIAPMLRVSPSDNLAVEMVAPTIEGFLDDSTVAWTLQLLKRRAVSFSLTENE